MTQLRTITRRERRAKELPPPAPVAAGSHWSDLYCADPACAIRRAHWRH